MKKPMTGNRKTSSSAAPKAKAKAKAINFATIAICQDTVHLSAHNRRERKDQEEKESGHQKEAKEKAAKG